MRLVATPQELPSGQEVAEAASQHPLGISGAVSWDEGGQSQVRLFGPGCMWATVDEATADKPDSARSVLVWYRNGRPRATQPGSRTDLALQLLAEDPSLAPAQAAARVGIHPSAVYRAQQRSARPVCACCGQPINQPREETADAP